MKKILLILIFLLTGVIFVSPQKVNAVSPYKGGPWETKLLGMIIDKTSAYASCPEGYKAVGALGCNYSDPRCVGGPIYTITWSQPARNDSYSLRSDYTPGYCEQDASGKYPPECLRPGCTPTAADSCLVGTNNACWPPLNQDGAGIQKPRFTFEWSSVPIGSITGEPVTVTVKMDDPNFKLTHWSFHTTRSNGQDCSVTKDSGIFENPGPEQTIEVKVIKNGDCKWNHLLFSREFVSEQVTLSGKVFDQDGKGIAGVKVNDDSVAKDSSWTKNCNVGTATTDANGNFQLSAYKESAFCLRFPQITGYETPKGSYECQYAGIDKGQVECVKGMKLTDSAKDDAYNFTYTKSGSSGGGSSPTPTPTPTPTPSSAASSSPAAPTAFTTKFRIAENPADLNTAPWQDYTADGMTLEYDFKTPGQKFIFVQYMDSTDRTTTAGNCPTCKAQIKILGPNPVITSCSLGFEGNNTVLNLTGQNFGSGKGVIKSGNKTLQVRDWKDDKVRAVVQNLPAGEKTPVILTNTDEQVSEEIQCSSASGLSLGAKVFCRAPSSHDTDDVDLTLAGAFEGGTKHKQKIKIDKSGAIVGLDQKLEEGRKYQVSLKAPRSVRRKIDFTAAGGTTNIPNFTLPVGDIYPLDGGDGVINVLDKAELNRQWVIAADVVSRTGDFNRDGRVNSFDWACMRYDFGSRDDGEAEPGGPPDASPSPSASSSPSASPIVSASPTASPTPTPSGNNTPQECEFAAPPEGCHYEGEAVFPECNKTLVCS